MDSLDFQFAPLVSTLIATEAILFLRLYTGHQGFFISEKNKKKCDEWRDANLEGREE